MKILVTGSHGLVGSALVPILKDHGHQLLSLVRKPPRPGKAEVQWEPVSHSLAVGALDGVEAVIHLAGENLACARWTSEHKARIRDSRVGGTRLLSEAMAAAAHPPRVFLSASAVGYYGSRGEELLTESSAAGSGFLADVCREWEAATEPARQAGTRVVLLRFGMILTARGGALAKMIPAFKLGLGGVLGSGLQFWSWIALEDTLAAIEAALLAPDTFDGPVNVVAPEPVTNRQFTRVLGQVLGRPTLLPVPALALRLALGQMADEALLASTRVTPATLLRAGFEFEFPTVLSALIKQLGARGQEER